MRRGICCIVLSLQDRTPALKFNTMTYKKFSSMNRKDALHELGKRILNNMQVTGEAIQFCYNNNYTYRLSSDLFPLITYTKAHVKLEDLPNYKEICDTILDIRDYIIDHPVRLSSHPSVEFISLDSEKYEVALNSAKELNMHGWLHDILGLPQDYSNPINIHLKNEKRTLTEVCDLFMERFFSLLNENVKKRLVLENNDKPKSQWNVKNLYNTFYVYCKEKHNHQFPITFDYLHNICNPSFQD